MLLLVGDPNDLSFAYLNWLAQARDFECRVLDEERFGLDWWIERTGGDWMLHCGGEEIEQGHITGAVVRFNPDSSLSESVPLEEDLAGPLLIERRAGLCHWLDTADMRVVNRPIAGRCNASKPYQMSKLSSIGLRVPDWIATNDPETAREVSTEWDKTIVKSCSGIRSRVRLLNDETIERMGSSTPVLLQRYIPGVDVRVHSIDNRCFASRVISKGIDYRWDEGEKQYDSIDMSPEIGDLCCSAAADLGLSLAGTDFRVDEDNVWWCLEVNPVPTFLPYEASTGHPLGDAVLAYANGNEPMSEHQVSPLQEFISSGVPAND